MTFLDVFLLYKFRQNVGAAWLSMSADESVSHLLVASRITSENVNKYDSNET